ncbi:hypothetical protein ABZN46_05740 [Campylobacter jejuni]|uniref:hypothetical protein n=1 Tax=Campylobacter jejuni TaxID=197 RepID=UPI000A782938|nr:hypothetical protein [Campylobacter jejuni]
MSFFEDVFNVTKRQTNEEYACFVISRTPKAVEFAKKYGVRFFNLSCEELCI